MKDSTIITVIYPQTLMGKFDTKYYVENHMPHVERAWKSKGLKSWSILQFTGTASGDASPYLLEAKMEWTSLDAFKKATAEDGPELFADVPKFTDINPVILFGDSIAKG